MSNHFVITGCPKTWPQNQSPPSRLEINDLIKIDDQFSLFIQAMAKMQAAPVNQGTSHFQISGIHGAPFVPWERSGSAPVNGAPSNANWDGYCTHGSVLFPTWHRPYLALFEQVLNSTAQQVAQAYPDKGRWTAAANNLRLPFWDWDKNAIPPPELIELTQVNILMPDGNKRPMNNPLLSFNFHGNQNQLPKGNWASRPQTVRYPGFPDPVGALKKRLQATAQSRHDSVERLLNFVKTWDDFSNHTQAGNDTKSSSLEAIHDSIHVLVGGGGHMNDPVVAAFDPIFYLHHCNVDRLFALWQSRNPNTWVSQGSSQEGTFNVAANSPEDANTKLTPFWNGPGSNDYWTSNGSRSMQGMGYTYPDFAGLNHSDPASVSQAMNARIQAINNPPQPTAGQIFMPHTFLAQAAPNAFTNFNVSPPQGTPGPAVQQQATTTRSGPSPGGQHDFAQQAHQVQQQAQFALAAAEEAVEGLAHRFQLPFGGHHAHKAPTALGPSGRTINMQDGFLDWTARIRFKKFELRESVAVHIFLKEPPADPIEWIGCDGYVGSHFAFVNSTLDQCANCADRAQTVNEGYVHLNSAIAKYSGLHSFDTEAVEPYLTSQLRWRVQSADLKTPIATAELSSLEVTVLSARITMPQNAIIPVMGQVKHHHYLTRNKQGGSRSA